MWVCRVSGQPSSEKKEATNKACELCVYAVWVDDPPLKKKSNKQGFLAMCVCSVKKKEEATNKALELCVYAAWVDNPPLKKEEATNKARELCVYAG